MSGWQTRDPADVGLNPSDYTDGQIPALSGGLFVPANPPTGRTIDAGQTQADGTILYRYGIDVYGRPTFTPDGTADTPGIVTLHNGRFTIEETNL